MFDTLLSGVRTALGLDAEALTIWQMVLRAIVVYPVAIAFVRLGEKRFIGTHLATRSARSGEGPPPSSANSAETSGWTSTNVCKT
ncbi:MAG: hypothetical protein H0T76_21415 [Nannocystis sp.]|nr:hypothetical protein [Nannocystis sp.]MBA3549051.1 hypothetical protein [Nannocystis sp.]